MSPQRPFRPCRLPHLAAALGLAGLAAGVIAAEAQTAEPERKIRNVTPQDIPVIILPPRNDPKDGGKTAVPTEPISGERMIATVSEEGALYADGKRLRLSGIAAVPAGALCESAVGGRWACGLRAYVALRNFVHNKEIRCEILAERADGAFARCHRERMNLSLWLLSEGWALYDSTTPDEALFKAGEDARKSGRGIWANGSHPLAANK